MNTIRLLVMTLLLNAIAMIITIGNPTEYQSTNVDFYTQNIPLTQQGDEGGRSIAGMANYTSATTTDWRGNMKKGGIEAYSIVLSAFEQMADAGRGLIFVIKMFLFPSLNASYLMGVEAISAENNLVKIIFIFLSFVFFINQLLMLFAVLQIVFNRQITR